MRKTNLTRPKKKSISLIELIVAIVIIGICFPVLFGLIGDVTRKVTISEGIAMGTVYAQEKMEEVRSKDFSSVATLFGTDIVGGFTRTVTISYCQLSGTQWVTTGSVTDYKMITVSVSKAIGSIPTVTLVTIIANL